MDIIDFSKLNRNSEVFKKYFTLKDNKTYTTERIRMVIPNRFLVNGLCIIGNITRVVSIYALLDDYGNYTLVNVPIMQEVLPDIIKDVYVKDDVYKELLFHKDSLFLTNNDLVINDNFIYTIYDDFYIKGNIPHYLSDPNDVADVLTQTSKYAGMAVDKNPLIFEILTAIIGRDKNNIKNFYRLTGKPDEQPVYIGLGNIFAYKTTSAKIAGGYMGAGVGAALVDPETVTSTVSNLLKA